MPVLTAAAMTAAAVVAEARANLRRLVAEHGPARAIFAGGATARALTGAMGLDGMAMRGVVALRDRLGGDAAGLFGDWHEDDPYGFVALEWKDGRAEPLWRPPG